MSDLEKTFTKIYKDNFWGNLESVSGHGSTLVSTESLREQLLELIEKFSIKKIFDGPCGDFNWMQHVLPYTDVEYVGGDIVKELINKLNIKYGSEKVSFIHVDLTKDPLPQADLMICRDCLYHCSYEDTWAILNNFLRSNTPYLLTTTFVDVTNRDITTGGFKPINLFLPPYNFPTDALATIIEQRHGKEAERQVLWSREQIVEALRSNPPQERKELPKIFISIASYRDPLLHNTVMSAFNNATHKNRLVFGVVDQSFPGEFFNLRSLPFAEQVRYLRIDPEYGRGACWARNLAQSMWNGEEYFFQVDSHTLFNERWDEIFVNYMHEFEKYHERPVITAYPHGFLAVDNNINNLKKSSYDGLLTLVADQAYSFNNDMYVGIQARVLPSGMPVHGFLISANCLFSHGVICEEVPYDPYLYFSGEEHSLALRLWTSGYNIFHVSNIPVHHHYGRDYRTTVWSDDFIEKNRPQKWYLYDKDSKNRLANVVTGKLQGVYGIGNKRTLEQYIDWSGIDYLNKTLNTNAVSGDDSFKLDYKQAPV